MLSISRNALFVSLFITAATVCSCGGNDVKTRPSIIAPPVQAATNFAKLDTPLHFSGLWVNENYITNVKKSKSPKAAQSAGDMKSCINIPLRTLETTSFIMGFHEGGDPLVVVKNGGKYQLWDQQSPQPQTDIEVVAPDRLKIGPDFFVKMTIPGNSAAQDLSILSSVLFRGNYITPNGTTVELKENGEVKGLDGYTTYSPIIDYSDAALDVDQVIMEGPGKPAENFGFRFVNDVLLIYQLKCLQSDSATKRCIKVDFGETKYILKRK